MSKRVADLEGAELDYWVAKAEQMRSVHGYLDGDYCLIEAVAEIEGYGPGIDPVALVWMPSADWIQGGPIIERERITVEWADAGRGAWHAYIRDDEDHPGFYGSTPLVAAMRAFVASEFGATVQEN